MFVLPTAWRTLAVDSRQTKCIYAENIIYCSMNILYADHLDIMGLKNYHKRK